MADGGELTQSYAIHDRHRERRDKLGSLCPRPTWLCLRWQKRKEVTQLVHEAIEFHLDDLKEKGAQIPPPTSKGDYVEVLAA